MSSNCFSTQQEYIIVKVNVLQAGGGFQFGPGGGGLWHRPGDAAAGVSFAEEAALVYQGRRFLPP